MPLTCYVCQPSQPCRALKWLTVLKPTVELAWKEINILTGEHVAPEYTAKNMYQAVPSLELEDGSILTESAAILIYLCEKNQITDLWPSDIVKRARVMEALMKHDDFGRKATTGVIRELFAKMRGATPEQIAAAIAAKKEDLAYAFGMINTVLGKQTYVAGAELSIADLLLTVEMNQLPALQQVLPAELKMDQFPNIVRYLEDMKKVAGHDEAFAPFAALVKAVA